jgi:hypothetical protein
MPKKILPKIFVALTLLFILVTAFCLLFGGFLDEHKINHLVLMASNLLLYLLSVITLAMHYKAMQSPNPNVFIRSVMGGSFMKLMVIAVAIVAYLSLAGASRSLYAVLCTMLLYIFYTTIEVRNALKMNRQVNGGS